MKIKRIEAIYDPGSETRQEDGMVNNYPFFGVIDTFSAPYDPERGGPALFSGLSGGEMLKKIVLETFYSASPNHGLEKILLRANKNIAEFWAEQEIPVERSDMVAGASFAFAKIMPEKNTIKIIQGGDCIAAWTYNLNEFSFTPNQAYGHVTEAIQSMAEIMERNNGSRKGLWKEFYGKICQMRIRDQNKPFTKNGLAILNGQQEVISCWHKKLISISHLSSLLLFSDGYVPDTETGVTQESILRAIRRFSISDIIDYLEETRSLQSLRRNRSHIDFPEATALGIKFYPERKK